MDLVWGNIREFLTDEILEKYDRIGNQGHSTLFKNNPDVNLRYKKCIGGLLNYRDVYTSEKSFCFDESGLDAIYNALEECIIAAGSIVTKDVPPNSVVAGIPARKISTYEEAKRKALNYSGQFSNTSFNGDTWVSELNKNKPVHFEK